MCLALLRGKHAVAAERQEHALHALIKQRLRGLMERCIVCDLHAGEELCFNAVGFERVDMAEKPAELFRLDGGYRIDEERRGAVLDKKGG